MSGTVSFSWGKWGGINYMSGFSKRLCLGWFAIHYFPTEIENILLSLTGAAPDINLSSEEWLEKDRYRYAFEAAGIEMNDQDLIAFMAGLDSHRWVYAEDYPTPAK